MQLTEWEKIFTNHVSDHGLISRLCEGLLQLKDRDTIHCGGFISIYGRTNTTLYSLKIKLKKKRKKYNPILKQAMDFNRYFTKKVYK